MRVAVIPARGGSKRIPRKNIKFFNGKPMIAWAISIAKDSGLFDRIIVSTDDLEIANIANLWGAETPFVRPEHLSNDYAGTTEVIAHATEWAMKQGWDLEAVCCIYPTTPFLQVEDLLNGWKALNSDDWAYSFGVTEFAAPIFRAIKQSKNGGVEMFFPQNFNARSQDLPQAFHDAGTFYWGRPDAWINGVKVFDSSSIPVVIPRWRVQDIDTLDDWIRAELMSVPLKAYMATDK